MKNKTTKKLAAIILALITTISTAFVAYAHVWPEDINKWTTEDWKVLNDYWANQWKQQQTGYYYNPYEINLCGSSGYSCYSDPNDLLYRGNNYNTTYCQTSYNGGYDYNYSSYNYYSGVMNAKLDSNFESQAVVLAKIIYLYGNGVASQTQQAAIGWCVLNCVDASGYKATVCTVANNFHYDASLPTIDNYGRDLMPLARDVIFRWKAGKAGISNNGRVLPSGYNYVWSDGTNVWFRNTPNESGAIWSFGYGSPYSI